MRSFRAEKLSAFIGSVIDGSLATAQEEYQQIKDNYPIFITRDLYKAKQWVKAQARGSERYGILASSGASRLKPEGLNVKNKIDAPTWFLNDQLSLMFRGLS